MAPTVIRFLPDTWMDALLRPVAMAAPNGGVYVEIMAPDFRPVFIILLASVLAGFLVWKRWHSSAIKPVAILLAVTTLAFVPWMLTTGNGRYFIPFLLLAGPLCLGLVYLLPMTRGFRMTLAVCLVAVQSFVVYEGDPLQSWGLLKWPDTSFFPIDLPKDMETQPATYVTISSISYSLIAPLLPSTSRWIGLASAPSSIDATMDAKRMRTIFASGLPLTLLIPSIAEYANAQGLPSEELINSVNTTLAPHRLAVPPNSICKVLPLNKAESSAKDKVGNKPAFRNIGFWACPLQYPMASSATSSKIPVSKFNAVFEKVEALCPRFFIPGGGGTIVINGGEVRHYGESDMKVYVTDEGNVLYKYFRSFTPQLIGSVDDVMSGKAKLNCKRIRGRSGLPWEREI